MTLTELLEPQLWDQLKLEFLTVAATGVSATTSVGTITYAVTYSLTGVSATGSATAPVIWDLVDTGADETFTQVNEGTTQTWSSVATSASQTWSDRVS